MAPTPLPQKTSLAVLREIILQIREVDMEYRWYYEPWDTYYKVFRHVFAVAVDQVTSCR